MLASTPPMGWNSWNGFGPAIDGTIVRETAEALVETGLRDLGYRYLVVDDCWSDSAGRDAAGDLVPNPDRFPDGVAPLVEHAHRLGLRFGIYSDAAELTCARYPGSLGFEERDAALWASWGIDYLKYDYCHAPADREAAIDRYRRMRKALDRTGREILLAICEWGERQPWRWAREIGGQTWRATGDVFDLWADAPDAPDAPERWFGIEGVIDQIAELGEFSGPGGWNDLDMLVVGLDGRGAIPGRGATLDEYRTQVSMWSLLASPLMIGCDIRSMRPEIAAMLSNPEIIAIDQDPLGRAARRVHSDGGLELWRRPLANGAVALGLLNRRAEVAAIEVRPRDVGLEGPSVWLRDAWERADIGRLGPGRTVEVRPHATSVLVARDVERPDLDLAMHPATVSGAAMTAAVWR